MHRDHEKAAEMALLRKDGLFLVFYIFKSMAQLNNDKIKMHDNRTVTYVLVHYKQNNAKV